MPHQRACDRCYKSKVKCLYEGKGTNCALCRNSGSTCTTARVQLRTGRRPKVHPICSQGYFEVWDLKIIEDTKFSSNTSLRQIRDCSRGYATVASDNTSESESSSRFHLLSRGLYRRGIKSSNDPFHEPFPELMEQFYAMYDLFMLGPTFAPSLRATFQQSYAYSPPLLQDILNAFFSTINYVKHHKVPWDPVDTVKGATALQELRTMQISGKEDALVILTLGQILAAFDLLTDGVSSMLILRYALLSAQPWYEELSRNPSLGPITISPILWDTVHCIVRRKIPVIRYQTRDPYTVDRMAGLCTTLLPILYDLCVAIHDRCHIDNSALKEIEDRLTSWMPVLPLDLATSFSYREILGMQTQASMYRIVGLLVAYRVRNTIGAMDDTATLYAKSIMLEFSRYSTLVGQGTKLQNVAFPILIASLELPNVSKDIWEGTTLASVAPVCVARMTALVEYVWTERAHGFTSHMLDLVNKGPDFTVFP